MCKNLLFETNFFEVRLSDYGDDDADTIKWTIRSVNLINEVIMKKEINIIIKLRILLQNRILYTLNRQY